MRRVPGRTGPAGCPGGAPRRITGTFPCPVRPQRPLHFSGSSESDPGAVEVPEGTLGCSMFPAHPRPFHVYLRGAPPRPPATSVSGVTVPGLHPF